MNAHDLSKFNWPEYAPRTNAEFKSYPQFTNDQFGYRLVRIGHAWQLELENTKLREKLDTACGALRMSGRTELADRLSP